MFQEYSQHLKCFFLEYVYIVELFLNQRGLGFPLLLEYPHPFHLILMLLYVLIHEK